MDKETKIADQKAAIKLAATLRELAEEQRQVDPTAEMECEMPGLGIKCKTEVEYFIAIADRLIEEGTLNVMECTLDYDDSNCYDLYTTVLRRWANEE